MIAADSLKRIAVWSLELTERESEVARAGIIEKPFKANEFICMRGDNFEFWTGVVTGLVKIGTMSHAGNTPGSRPGARHRVRQRRRARSAAPLSERRLGPRRGPRSEQRAARPVPAPRSARGRACWQAARSAPTMPPQPMAESSYSTTSATPSA